jgi:copper chaperone
MEKVVFKVQGMSCTGCVNTVRNVLMEKAGVVAVDVDLAGGSVAIDFDPQRIGHDVLKSAIVNAGYEVV